MASSSVVVVAAAAAAVQTPVLAADHSAASKKQRGQRKIGRIWRVRDLKSDLRRLRIPLYANDSQKYSAALRMAKPYLDSLLDKGQQKTTCISCC